MATCADSAAISGSKIGISVGVDSVRGFRWATDGRPPLFRAMSTVVVRDTQQNSLADSLIDTDGVCENTVDYFFCRRTILRQPVRLLPVPLRARLHPGAKCFDRYKYINQVSRKLFELSIRFFDDFDECLDIKRLFYLLRSIYIPTRVRLCTKHRRRLLVPFRSTH